MVNSIHDLCFLVLKPARGTPNPYSTSLVRIAYKKCVSVIAHDLFYPSQETKSSSCSNLIHSNHCRSERQRNSNPEEKVSQFFNPIKSKLPKTRRELSGAHASQAPPPRHPRSPPPPPFSSNTAPRAPNPSPDLLPPPPTPTPPCPPYVDDVQAAIVAHFAALGVEIAPAMERHLGVAKNTQIGLIGEDVLDGLVEEVVQGTGVEAVATFCTNWTAVQRVETWEEKWGLPVFDTVSVGVWDMLMMAGFGMKDLKGWGSLFQKS